MQPTLRSFLLVPFVVLAMFASSCEILGGGDDDNDNGGGAAAGPIAAFTVLSGDELTSQSTSELSGTGSVIFNSELDAVASGANFTFTGTIDDGGQIAITTYSSAILAGGVSFVFNRSGSTLQLLVLEGETTAATYITELTTGTDALDPSGSMTVSIDVHNDEDPTHVLVWNNSSTTLDEDSALVNDETNLSTGGTDRRCGLSLSNATVTAFSVGEVAFEEE